MKRQPELIQSMTWFAKMMARANEFGLAWLPDPSSELVEVAQISVRFGLLTGDAALVHTCIVNGITHLATNDDDFDRVPGLTIWKPR